jgi:hypothetical protein
MKIRLKVPLSSAAIVLASWNSAAWPQAVSAASGGARLSQEMIDNAAASEGARKQELIAQILTARETASGRKFTEGLRGHLAGLLMTGSVGALEAFQNTGGLGDIEAAVREGAVTNTLGDPAADLAFTPVAPCRVVDTRSAATGLLVAGAAQNFLVRNAAGFATQGGSATDCGIPLTATSVEMNFVAVGAAGPGDIRAYPFSGTFPNASVINYSNVPGAPLLNIANAIAQPVCNPATSTCTKDLTVLAEASNTHLIIDVVGYFNKVNTAPIKSFTVNSVRSGVSGAVTTTCSNAGGAQVTVVAPVAGKVVVNGLAMYSISHTTGGSTQVNAFLGTTATDCPGVYGADAALIVPSQFPTFTSWFYDEHPIKTFPVAAGSTTTFFLNSLQFTGPATETIQHSSITATFIPN